ncbi:hypothetical protein GCM10010168_12280 [Actinoplanes ianthinogenes]|uniref:Uncharacterized protein n=1 Tax=Actinoplanes ianthinogenes TaxID=122358 RepID=A0ABM7LYL4_9ACTN|nr:hypothetical protein [Actinoplanes ianthinogenes]BCJ44414.1 hypothetical protein Aiant_50710 [Actinoplanes ianthinogenes]GGQ97867.1 hypothetical protein GCM10010168_12280 [Actinoplanes ianthinogenes]
MSFDELMEHARDIQAAAIAAAMKEKGVREAPRPGDPPYTPHPGEDAARAAIFSEFADVPSLFEPFAMTPDPASFDGLLQELSGGMNHLSSGRMPDDPITGDTYLVNVLLDRVGATESYLDQWTGDGGDKFRSKFVHDFSSIVTNQFIGCAVLRGALEAQKALWLNARANIDTVAHDTLTALDNMGHCGQNQWTMTWTIVASVAAVAAVPLSAGTSLLGAAAAVTAVGAAGQVIAAHQLNPKKETHYHGETAAVVIEQMRRGVAQAIGEIQQGEQLIAGVLRSLHASIDQHRGMFVSPRPALLDATPSTVFDDKYLGHAR